MPTNAEPGGLTEPTNAERAARAMDALVAHAGGRTAPVYRRSLIDLMTDLRHWADAYGADFDNAITWSEEHWIDEVKEERRGA